MEMAQAKTSDLTDSLLDASRALVGIAVQSIIAVNENVTVVQFRCLAHLSNTGPHSGRELADALNVSPSTASRLCVRLLRGSFIKKRASSHDLRMVEYEISTKGRRLVRDVIQLRREELGRIVKSIPATKRRGIIDAMRAFSDAANEAPEQAWSTGWVT